MFLHVVPIKNARDPPDVHSVASRYPQHHFHVIEEGVVIPQNLFQIQQHWSNPVGVAAVNAVTDTQETVDSAAVAFEWNDFYFAHPRSRIPCGMF
jgi:hypothetical protein